MYPSVFFTKNQVLNYRKKLFSQRYHVGQIVFIGKMLTDGNWQSLSIPRGNSTQYNAEKFAQPKGKRHFTVEFLTNKKG